MVIVSDNFEKKYWIPSSRWMASYLEQCIGIPFRRKNQENIGGELDQSIITFITRMLKRMPDPSRAERHSGSNLEKSK